MINLNRFIGLADVSGILSILNGKFVRTINDSFFCVVKTNGINFSSKSEEETNNTFSSIENIIVSSGGNYDINVVFYREQHFIETNQQSTKLSDIHERTMGDVYKNHYYIIIRRKSIYENASKGIKRLSKKNRKNWKVTNFTMPQVERESLLAFASTFAYVTSGHILENNHLLSALTYIYSGSKRGFNPDGLNQDGEFFINQLISQSTLDFSYKSNFSTFPLVLYKLENVFSKVIHLRFKNKINPNFILDLLRSNVKLRFDLSIDTKTKEGSIHTIEEIYSLTYETFEKQASSMKDVDKDEQILLKQEIEKGNELLSSVGMIIEVYGKEDVIQETIDNITQLASQYLVICKIFDDNLMGWFGRFPENAKFLPMTSFLTSSNVAQNLPIIGSENGLTETAWGSALAMFKTTEGTPYNFNFQNTSQENALGHTLLIGASESGKTTFVQFLMMCALEKYDDLRILGFDRLNGMYCWTNTVGGAYVDLETELQETTKMNPFIEFGDKGDRLFLVEFVSLLITSSGLSASDKNDLEEQISNVINRPNQERSFNTLTSLLEAVGFNENALHELKAWEYGEGKTRNIFNAQEINAEESKIQIYDFGSMIDNTDLSVPLLFYLIKRAVNQQNKSATPPLIIFVDELLRYARNEAFADFILEMLQEIRKKGGVFVGAIQNIEALKTNKISSAGNSIANLFIFPDTKMPLSNIKFTSEEDGNIFGKNDLELYKTALGLKTRGDRVVLLKNTVGDNSYLLNVDLGHLGKKLTMFSSNIQTINQMKNLTSKGVTDWYENI